MANGKRDWCNTWTGHYNYEKIGRLTPILSIRIFLIIYSFFSNTLDRERQGDKFSYICLEFGRGSLSSTATKFVSF